MMQILPYISFKGISIRQCKHLLHVPVLVVVPEHVEPIGSHDSCITTLLQYVTAVSQVHSFQRAIFMTRHNDSLHCAAEPEMATAVELPPLQADITGSSIDIADGDSIKQQGGPLLGPKDAAASCVPTVRPESAGLSTAAVARLRHRVNLWKKRAWGRAWCLRFGMTASSWHGWSKMHVNPFIAMRFCFLSAAGHTLTNVYIATSLPMPRSMLFYVATLPFLLHAVVMVALACAMFRLGPQVAFHRTFPLAWLSMALLPFPVWYLGYVGPQHTLPWNNPYQFLAASFLSLLFGHLTAAAGGISGEHPMEPRTSITKPAFRAVIQTVRATDILTDLSLIGELLAEVQC